MWDLVLLYVESRETVSMNSFDRRFAPRFKSCWSKFWFAGSGTLTCDCILGILQLKYMGFYDIYKIGESFLQI